MNDAVAQDQLRAFVERLERMEEEIAALNADKREIYAEAKGSGFDVPTLKQVLKVRRMDHSERMERDALLDLYLQALGMTAVPAEEPHVQAHVHVHEGLAPALVEKIAQAVQTEAGRAALGAAVDIMIEREEPSTEPQQPESGPDAAAPSQAKASTDSGATEPAHDAPADSATGDASRSSVGGGSDAPILQEGTVPAEAHNLGAAGSTPAPATPSGEWKLPPPKGFRPHCRKPFGFCGASGPNHCHTCLKLHAAEQTEQA